jgi:hypothetical protein
VSPSVQRHGGTWMQVRVSDPLVWDQPICA